MLNLSFLESITISLSFVYSFCFVENTETEQLRNWTNKKDDESEDATE